VPKDVRKKRLRAHAGGRAATRYGLGQHEVDAIGRRVQLFFDQGARPQEDMALIKTQSESRKLIAVKVGDQWIPAVYHSKRQVVMTFLPPIVLEGFTPPRPPTADDQKEAWLSGERIPVKPR